MNATLHRATARRAGTPHAVLMSLQVIGGERQTMSDERQLILLICCHYYPTRTAFILSGPLATESPQTINFKNAMIRPKLVFEYLWIPPQCHVGSLDRGTFLIIRCHGMEEFQEETEPRQGPRPLNFFVPVGVPHYDLISVIGDHSPPSCVCPRMPGHGLEAGEAPHGSAEFCRCYRQEAPLQSR